MATLTTIATIRAHDALTGPLSAMASRVNAISGRFAAGAHHMGRAGASMGIGMAGGVYGLSALLAKAEEFNKDIFGIGAASISEAQDAAGNVNLQKSIDEMDRMEAASMRLSRELGMSVTAISGIEETLAKAGMSGDKLDAVARSAATLSKTDLETPANQMADFLHTLSVIQKPKEGEGFGQFMKRQADMVFAAAATTKLSVGSMMEGMKQFQTIGAGMGLDTEEMLALVMGGAQRGFNASELGTALKSDMVRAVKPDAAGQAALTRILSGMKSAQFPHGRNIADFAQMEAIDPTRATGNLMRSVGIVGAGSAKFRGSIFKQLFKAQQEGYTTSDGFIDELTNQIAKKKGITDHEGMQNIRNAVVNSTAAPSGGYKFIDLMRSLVEGGATDADLASVFEGRQLARNKAFTDLFKREEGKASEYDQMLQMLKRQNGQGLDAVETLWSNSNLGNVKAMQAAWERLTISLANAPGLQKFVNFAERAADGLTQLNPQFLDLTMRAAGLAIIGPPLLSAIRGFGEFGAAAWMAARGFGGLLALPFARFAGLAGRTSAGMAGMALKAVMLGTGFKALQNGGKALGVLGSIAGAVAKVARFAGPFALVAGAYELFQNWESITGVFEQIGNSESVMKLGAAFTQLWTALSPLGTAMGNFIDGLMRLMGMDPANSSFFNGITWMIDKFTALIQVITAAVNKFNEFAGLQEAPGGKIGTQTGKTRQVGRGMSFVPNGVYGPERPAAPDTGPIPAVDHVDGQCALWIAVTNANRVAVAFADCHEFYVVHYLAPHQIRGPPLRVSGFIIIRLQNVCRRDAHRSYGRTDARGMAVWLPNGYQLRLIHSKCLNCIPLQALMSRQL